ncbi:trace amine-associated receptor 13c-like [Plectropomus leopardus]|uniref:trace amine-associated receptor 13c-like n=1 Tax=Plectropomus leopardus TaxID=160734 RepID=UPI001C4AA657|nr:trace amine-associated receptor 13c-like [Plectropomus leopardus]
METLEGDELCFPQLLNSSCRKPRRPHTGVTLFYFLSLISVFTTALNLLVIISISHFRQLHTTTNLLLLSLAVSDFLVGLIVMPAEIILAETCWFLGDLICAVYYLLPFIIVSASVESMVLISVDRYVAICYPLHYPNKVTFKRVRLAISLCWICSLLVSIVILYDHLKKPGTYNSCYGECVVDIAGDVDLVLNFIIPISIIIILYMRVFVVAVSQARALRSHITAVTLQRSRTVTDKRSELKAARTLGIVVAVFLMCYCPYYCLALTGGTIMIGSSAEAFMSFLMYFNSCLNPVIYAFFYPWFRKAVRLIVTLQVMQPGSCEANIL